MAVTLYRQVGKGKTRAPPISPVPVHEQVPSALACAAHSVAVANLVQAEGTAHRRQSPPASEIPGD